MANTAEHDYRELVLKLLGDIGKEVSEIRKEQKDIPELIDKKLEHCELEIISRLRENHYTQKETDTEITLAVQAYDKRLMNRVTTFGLGVGFVGFVFGVLRLYGPAILVVLKGG